MAHTRVISPKAAMGLAWVVSTVVLLSVPLLFALLTPDARSLWVHLIAVLIIGVAVAPLVEWLARRSARRLVAELAAEHPAELTFAVRVDPTTAEALGSRATAMIARTNPTGIEFWSEQRPPGLAAVIAWTDVEEVSYASMTIVMATAGKPRELLFEPDSLAYGRLLSRTIWERAWTLASELEKRRAIHWPLP